MNYPVRTFGLMAGIVYGGDIQSIDTDYWSLGGWVGVGWWVEGLVAGWVTSSV